MIIPDNETEVDYLYYEAISNTIIETIEQAGQSPVTIGVHGDWGAGKSSVLKMIESKYGTDDDTLCVHFNGWLFQGFEETKTVLIESIIAELVQQKKTSQAVKDKAAELLSRVNWLKLAKKGGGLAFTAMTGIPSIDQAKDLISGLKGLIGQSQNIESSDIESLVEGASGMLSPAKAETIPDQIHAFRVEFAELLKIAKVERLVVVVDDLDRCLPETAIETLEAIRLFLFVPGSAFVVAADEAMIEYAVRKHFPDLPLSTGPASYARNYLEKLIQVPFRLPPLGSVETRTYITLLLVSQTLNHSDDKFTKLIELTRNVLRRPWGGEGFNRESIKESLGEIPPEVESALQLADQIA
ncbi:P-loop NTPase fold protein, partial [uncultured Parasphingorhabdus sp.]|uniref:KAP family P-loop NTPase fold protein n=1 Tax=uncultured Parasphingorhabdus sp. TaxID=2709694 RepID=UPI0030DC21D2